jgi:hypothetical protein
MVLTAVPAVEMAVAKAAGATPIAEATMMISRLGAGGGAMSMQIRPKWGIRSRSRPAGRI